MPGFRDCMKCYLHSGNMPKSGSFSPESVAGLNRNTRQVYAGMGGRIRPDFPSIIMDPIDHKGSRGSLGYIALLSL